LVSDDTTWIWAICSSGIKKFWNPEIKFLSQLFLSLWKFPKSRLIRKIYFAILLDSALKTLDRIFHNHRNYNKVQKKSVKCGYCFEFFGEKLWNWTNRGLRTQKLNQFFSVTWPLNQMKLLIFHLWNFWICFSPTTSYSEPFDHLLSSLKFLLKARKGYSTLISSS
jgi:hypothetical protein